MIALYEDGGVISQAELRVAHHCDYSQQSAKSLYPSPSDIEYGIFDEGAQCDLSGVVSAPDTDCESLLQPARRYNSIVHTMWRLLCVTSLTVFAAFLGLDLTLGECGVGLLSMDCTVARHLPPPPLANEVGPCYTPVEC
jgi:hypothetical protein